MSHHHGGESPEFRIAIALEEALEVWKEERDVLNQALDTLRCIERILAQKPGNMALRWGPPEVHNAIQQLKEEDSMPGKETDTQTIPCTEVETDGAGNPVTLDPANVTWAISDPTVAELTQNSDGSATFKAVKPVPPAVNPRTATVTCIDRATGVVGTDTLEVDDSPTQPGKMVLTFGAAG